MRTILLALALASTALPAAAFAGPAHQPRLVTQPELPSADRIKTWIRDRIGDEATTKVQLCLATDGHVSSARVLRGSAYPPFDRAVMHDVLAWRFAAAGAPRCMPATIVYHVH